MSRFCQGSFVPAHPEKYVGGYPIRYMSSWELAFHRFLDNNTAIIEWASESISIPYIKPTDGKVHHYFPDYYVKYCDRNGNIITEIIEIKPDTQTRAPRRKKDLYAQATFAINSVKWKAAQLYCEQHNYKFRILTEKQLFKS